jgi:glycerol uptake facilitator protein
LARQPHSALFAAILLAKWAGSIQGASSHYASTEHTVEEADAEEGPFPVDLKSMLIAEVFGTCMFVQIGCAANAVALYTHNSTTMTIDWQVGVVWALAMTVAVFLSAALSGAHLNPAVSFSFALARPADFRFRKLIPYWAAQLGGALLAGIVNLFLFHQAISHYEKKMAIVPGAAGSIQSAAAFGCYWSLNSKYISNGVHAFFIEAFGTGVLVFCIFAATHIKNPLPGVAVPPIIGAMYGVLVVTLGPMTGGSFNPVRDMGPRVVSVIGHWGPTALTNFLPYLLGPMIGGPIGAFLADKVLML